MIEGSAASRDLQALLENARWVQGLARRLVGSADLAEDLVQETWLAALRFPDQARSRSWLARVMRNLAFDRRRQDRRREARERKAAEFHSTGAGEAARVSELVERAEIHRSLVQAVLGLPEPYRAVILDRFFEGRSAREIAKLSRRPVATVRTQLQRGVELLRQRLERQWGKDWRQSCLLVAGSLAPPSLLASSAAAILMSTKLKIFLSAAAFLLLLTWVAVSPEELSDLPGATPQAASPALEEEAAGPAEQGESRRNALAPDSSSTATRQPETADDVAGEGVLAGHLLDSDGEGIPGASVITWADRELLETDQEGAFALPLHGPLDSAHLRLIVAWAPGFQLSYLQVSEPGPVNLRLQPAAQLDLEVVAAGSGAPIEGARARILLAGRSTSIDGDFLEPDWVELPFSLPPSDSLGRIPLEGVDISYCRITAAGYEDSLRFITRSTPSPIRIALHEPRSFPIRFLDLDGKAWGGARVDFEPSDGPVWTDSNGWVEVPVLSRPGFQTLGVRREDRGFVFYGDPGSSFPSRLEPGQVLEVGHAVRSGRLFLSSGQSWEDFEIATSARFWYVGDRLLPDPEKAPDSLSWFPVGTDGSFRIDQGWQGLRTAIHVRRKGDSRLVLSQELVGPGPYEIPLDLAGGASLSLRVQAEPAEVLRGTSVQLRPDRVRGRQLRPLTLPLVDGQTVTPLRPGTWSVILTGGAWQGRVVIGRIRMPEESAHFDFELGRLRQLQGEITAAGRPVAACSLRFSLEEGFLPEWHPHGLAPEGSGLETGFVLGCRPDKDGAWELPWVPDAPLRVQVETEDFWLEPGEDRFWRIPAGTGHFQIELPAGVLELSLAGEIPLDSRDVVVWRRKLPERGGGRIQSNRFGDRGHFPDLRSGQATLIALEREISWFHRDPSLFLSPPGVILRAGEVLSVELRLLPAGQVITVWEDEVDRYSAAKIRIEAADPATPPPRRYVAPEYNARSGGFLDAYSALPGEWRYTLRGPVSHLEPSGSHSSGTVWGGAGDHWSIPIQVVAGRKTVVKVRAEGDQLVLSAEVRE